MASENVEILQTFDTNLHADSVEWCPLEGLQHIMLCGTYQLLEDAPPVPGGQQIRVGELRVYSLDLKPAIPKLSLETKRGMPGILDIKWLPQYLHEKPVFGLVNAKGDLILSSFDRHHESSLERKDAENEVVSGSGDSLEEDFDPRFAVGILSTASLGECVGLSLDWANTHEGSLAHVVASDSTGSLSVYDLKEDFNLISR